MVAGRKIVPRVVALVCILSFIIYHAYYQGLRFSQQGLVDLTVFYVAGQSITGTNTLMPIQLYEQSKIRPVIQKLVPVAGTHFLYLPPAAVLFAPLAVLPLGLVSKIWLLMNVAVVLVCFYLAIYYLVPDRQLSRYRYSLVLVLLLGSSTVHSLFSTGQINAWLWLLFILGLIGLVHHKPALTGISLGIATIFKIFPIIFLPYLLIKKQYKAASYFVATDLALVALSLPWFKLTGWWWFISQRLPELLFGTIGSITTSVSSYGLIRWLIRYHAADFGLVPKVVVTWLYYPYLIITVLAIITVGYVLWKRSASVVVEYFLVVLLVLTFGKMVQAQYLLWLMPYLLWLWQHGAILAKYKIPSIITLIICLQYTVPVVTPLAVIALFGITLWCIIRPTYVSRKTSHYRV